LAHNIVANSRGKDLIPFRFNTLGLLASIGRRTGVARAFSVSTSPDSSPGGSGGRSTCLSSRDLKKLRVALDWTLDVFFAKDFVQYLHQRSALVVNTPMASSDVHPTETDPNRLSAPLTMSEGMKHAWIYIDALHAKERE
jgi:hypothetical protein